MLKIQEIRELINLIDQSSIEEFKFEQNGSKVTIRKQLKSQLKNQVETTRVVAAPPTMNVNEQGDIQQVAVNEVSNQKEETKEAAVKGNENYHAITSPMVGTFYVAPSPDSAPYVAVGDKVKEDSVVCIVEAMKLMNEIESEIKGEIVEVLVENGQLVEYGQELFLVKPE
ncbi:acetyl-CoA carboxylase biotin carboxyl carrier protein [Evansella sp. AB-P1]|uniref:acetyl-CoA carboxylase biotin carboxyl carrier protein n=1 Tax=Evansella sp. AB-P1 TaxID=3037653 RepID=UPI00241EF06D|nr:acetyl-CoA carboxylase biotin carboxyl carrier protein [Evansella sp. AB-P1]MDG5788693.1 acetyl-CoA carboxylase biotin carboxyl carrier protein [Evansella sp. AB-P1]